MSDTEKLNEAADSGLLQPRIVRLLPCPHCGAEAKLNLYQHDRTRVYYACSMPRCSYTYADEQDAAKAWNRRSNENALLAIDAQIEGNTQAASGDVSGTDAAWSLGVAKGLEIARGFIQPNDSGVATAFPCVGWRLLSTRASAMHSITLPFHSTY